MARSQDTATPLLLTLLAGVLLSWAGHLPPWPVGLFILAGAFGFALTGGRA